VVVVTGATSGIERAAARLFAENGAGGAGRQERSQPEGGCGGV
jgi:NAD(P)-dependent dehydrogenase (short-subunit alcohol dehydrogenase family)